MVHALLPVKNLLRAKNRLSGVLAPHERRLINLAMVEDVLEVLSNHTGVKSVLLVSDDRSAEFLATKYSAGLFKPGEVGAHGLNEELFAASEYLAQTGAGRILIIHGDLPLLHPSDLDALFESVASCQIDVAFGPDANGSGTNAMLVSAQDRPEFHYGPDSLAAHLASAQSLGLRYALVRRPGIEHDVDTAADLLVVQEASKNPALGQRTARFLCRDEIVQRLRLLRETGICPDDNRAACNG